MLFANCCIHRQDIPPQTSIANFQSSHADGQTEPPRSGAAGVEIQDAIFPFLLGPVRVAADHGGESCGLRIEIKRLQVMKQVDVQPAKHGNLGFRKAARPGLPVDVATDGSDRRDLLECRDDLRCSDVAGVEDVVGSAQQSQSFWPQEPMCVGDDANYQFERFFWNLKFLNLKF